MKHLDILQIPSGFKQSLPKVNILNLFLFKAHTKYH